MSTQRNDHFFPIRKPKWQCDRRTMHPYLGHKLTETPFTGRCRWYDVSILTSIEKQIFLILCYGTSMDECTVHASAVANHERGQRSMFGRGILSLPRHVCILQPHFETNCSKCKKKNHWLTRETSYTGSCLLSIHKASCQKVALWNFEISSSLIHKMEIGQTTRCGLRFSGEQSGST